MILLINTYFSNSSNFSPIKNSEDFQCGILTPNTSLIFVLSKTEKFGRFTLLGNSSERQG